MLNIMIINIIIIVTTLLPRFLLAVPQCGVADAEIKVPSVENTELEGSPFKAWLVS